MPSTTSYNYCSLTYSQVNELVTAYNNRVGITLTNVAGAPMTKYETAVRLPMLWDGSVILSAHEVSLVPRLQGEGGYSRLVQIARRVDNNREFHKYDDLYKLYAELGLEDDLPPRD